MSAESVPQNDRLVDRIRATLRKWRGPHFTIYANNKPYVRRWHLLPRSDWPSVYLHNICQSDDLRALHDHPYDNASLVLFGSYWEVTETDRRLIRAFRLTRRAAEQGHRIELQEDPITGAPKPVWSLFFVGRRRRDWGFLCPKGWRIWTDYVRIVPGGNTAGPGCD